jgi:uncharacterized protein with GYD domain
MKVQHADLHLFRRLGTAGLENIQDTPGRLDDAKKVVETAGGAIRDFYITTGAHDMVLVLEVPDDAALAKVLLTQARKVPFGPRRCVRSPSRSIEKFSNPCSPLWFEEASSGKSGVALHGRRLT